MKRNRRGRSVSAQARAQAGRAASTSGAPGTSPAASATSCTASLAATRSIVKLEVLGRTHQGREIIALKVTQGARGTRDGSRPAVLYSSNQHAREWISVEVNRRLLHHFIDGWRARRPGDPAPAAQAPSSGSSSSANPDGYQYTFDDERLWRKNLRDNDGDGRSIVDDGVDPNRNFAEHWGYDNEGSSPDPADETYRGPERRLGARDAGAGGPDRPHQAEVPVEPPLVRRVAAVSAGLADRDARRRQPALRGARRHRRQLRRSRASTRASRPTRCT